MSETMSDDLSFEEALVALGQTVSDLEEGQLGLEEALARYEQGVGLIKRCYAQLRSAEQRILQLTGQDDEGRPILQPFKHEATAAIRPDATRRSRPKEDSSE
jgi:exodeoxyribonuclease VII small subunit